MIHERSNDRIILYRKAPVETSKITPWFCAYAKYARSIYTYAYTQGSHGVYSKKEDNSALEFVFLNNITDDFISSSLMTKDRNCYFKDNLKDLVCTSSNVIYRIGSTTERLLLCIKTNKSIDLGGETIQFMDSFVICSELYFTYEHKPRPNSSGHPYELFKYINMRGVLQGSIDCSVVYSMFDKVEFIDDALRIDITNIDRVWFSKIEPYVKPYDNSMYARVYKKLEPFNKIKICDNNSLKLIYEPVLYNTSYGGIGMCISTVELL